MAVFSFSSPLPLTRAARRRARMRRTAVLKSVVATKELLSVLQDSAVDSVLTSLSHSLAQGCSTSLSADAPPFVPLQSDYVAEVTSTYAPRWAPADHLCPRLPAAVQRADCLPVTVGSLTVDCWSQDLPVLAATHTTTTATTTTTNNTTHGTVAHCQQHCILCHAITANALGCEAVHFCTGCKDHGQPTKTTTTSNTTHGTVAPCQQHCILCHAITANALGCEAFHLCTGCKDQGPPTTTATTTTNNTTHGTVALCQQHCILCLAIIANALGCEAFHFCTGCKEQCEDMEQCESSIATDEGTRNICDGCYERFTGEPHHYELVHWNMDLCHVCILKSPWGPYEESDFCLPCAATLLYVPRIVMPPKLPERVEVTTSWLAMEPLLFDESLGVWQEQPETPNPNNDDMERYSCDTCEAPHTGSDPLIQTHGLLLRRFCRSEEWCCEVCDQGDTQTAWLRIVGGSLLCPDCAAKDAG
ncbi:unnamed protein product [Polarella glacialis]|uniref:Uncharacterized protein n=1 Tax=Polarella glacialis TaxID=89957 RepID=A0A813FGP7_POLGL|nr:unnamed protein product [Polarella glacialis]